MNNVSTYLAYKGQISVFQTLPEAVFTINYSQCSNECNLFGEQRCSGFAAYQTCGNFDSDYCYEWSNASNSCFVGGYCNNSATNLTNKCQSLAGSSSCPLSEGKFCSFTQPSNSLSAAGQCGIAGASCFTCDVNNGYAIDSKTNSSCYLANCPSGTHSHNNVCISNICNGVAPSGANFSNGSAIYTVGNLSWAHVYGKSQAQLTSCQWSCAAGFKPNAAGNGCEVGKPVCSLFAGNCTNSTLSLGNFTNISNLGLCTNVGDSCIQCNDGYRFNGSQCVFVGVSPIGGCSVGKCYYNNSCLPDKFRLSNATGKFYCNSTNFVVQKAVNASCTRDYECEANFCGPEGKCVNLVNEVGAFRTWFKELRCWILSGFNTGSASYKTCVES